MYIPIYIHILTLKHSYMLNHIHIHTHIHTMSYIDTHIYLTNIHKHTDTYNADI